MKRLTMIVLGIICLGLIVSFVSFVNFVFERRTAKLNKGILIQVAEIKYPEDVIVLTEKDLKQAKQEGMKWSLAEAKALALAKENSDLETIATLEELNKKFNFQDVDLSLIKKRDYFQKGEKGVEGIDFVADACLYGLIRVKEKEIKRISELWHISFSEVISRLRKKIVFRIASGKDISTGPLDIFERPAKLEVFFEEQKILEEFYPPTTRIKLIACPPISSRRKFFYWVDSSGKIFEENPLLVNLFKNRRVTAVFRR